MSPFTLGSMFSFGTSTLSITIYPVIDALSESFPLITGAVSPAISFSSMKPRIVPDSSLPQTTNTSAIGLDVIQVFVPFST